LTFDKADLVNIPRLKGPNINYSLAARKAGLTNIEKAVRSVLGVIDTATGLFGGGTSFSSNISDRVGVMLISEQGFSFTKKMWLDDNGKQPANYADFMSASYIYDTYHTNLEVKNNARKLHEGMPIPFTDQKFFGLFQNNFVTLESTGEVAEITKASWYDEEYEASVDLSRKDDGGKNTKTVKIA